MADKYTPLKQVPVTELKLEWPDRAMAKGNVEELVVHGAVKEGSQWYAVVSYTWTDNRRRDHERVLLKQSAGMVFVTLGTDIYWRDVYLT